MATNKNFEVKNGLSVAGTERITAAGAFVGSIASATSGTTQSASDNTTKLATTAFTTTAITNVIGGAPGTLNTLNELAAAINDDASYASTLTSALATKLPLSGGTVTGALINTSTAGITSNSTSHAYLTANSSATTTASWVQHKQGGTGRWLAGVEGSETDYQLYAGGSTRLRVTAGGAVTIPGTLAVTSKIVTGSGDLAATFGATSRDTSLNISKASGGAVTREFVRFNGPLNLGISTGSHTTRIFGGSSAYVQVDTTGNLDCYHDVRLEDNKKVIFGASHDFQIYHNGSNSYIYNEVGMIILQSKSNQNRTVQIDRLSGGTPVNLSEMMSHNALQILNSASGSYLTFGGSAASTNIQAQLNGSTTKLLTLNAYGGNVGVGIAAPTHTLHVNSSGGANLLVSRTGESGGLYLETDGTNGVIRNPASESLKFQTAGNNTRMTIQGGGRVGIGTPDCHEAQLIVHASDEIAQGGNYNAFGNLHVTTDTRGINNGGTISMGSLGRTSGPTEYFRYAEISGRQETNTNGDPAGYMALATTSGVTNLTTTQMRITSNGLVNVLNNGGSGYSSYGKGSALRVSELSYNQSAVHYIEIGGNLPGYTAGAYNCLKTDMSDLHFAAGGTYTGYINQGGTFTDISDVREKENIVTITNATAKLKQLRGVYHTWKDTASRGADTTIGLIAQEVEAVVPEVVTTSGPTSLNTPASDTAGLKGVAYAKLIPLLIETIKELEARITTLEG